MAAVATMPAKDCVHIRLEWNVSENKNCIYHGYAIQKTKRRLNKRFESEDSSSGNSGNSNSDNNNCQNQSEWMAWKTYSIKCLYTYLRMSRRRTFFPLSWIVCSIIGTYSARIFIVTQHICLVGFSSNIAYFSTSSFSRWYVLWCTVCNVYTYINPNALSLLPVQFLFCFFFFHLDFIHSVKQQRKSFTLHPCYVFIILFPGLLGCMCACVYVLHSAIFRL